MGNENITRFVQDALNTAERMGVFVDSQGNVLSVDTLRGDAGETLFFERQLESVEQKLYETKLRELKYRKHIPVSNRDGAGAETIVYYQWTRVGMAKIIANPTDDLPRVDVFATRFTARVYSLGEAFGYSTQELRAAAMANMPLETFKVSAARRAIRELENKLAFNGDANYNITGFLNNANIPTVQAPAGAGASRLWTLKTPNEIIADVLTMVTGIRNVTNGVHEGNTLLLPITQYNHIAGTPRSDLSDTTILEFITKPGNTYGLKEVDWLTELTGAGTGGTDMAMLYEKDPEVLEARIPMEMISHPPQIKNLEFTVPIEARNAGTVVRYPLACRTMYNI